MTDDPSHERRSTVSTSAAGTRTSDGTPILQFHSVEEFLGHRTFGASVVRILHAGSPLEFVLVPGEAGSPLIVEYLAERTPGRRQSRRYTGAEIAEGMGASLVRVSDPSLGLDEDLETGWFAGHRGLRLQSVWPDVLDHVVRCCASSREIHFGVSAGGFAALYYSRDRRGAIAVPVNPQTSLRKQPPRSVQHYLRTAWGLEGGFDLESGLGSLPVVHDLNELYRHGHSNTVVYLQNVQDDHVTDHLVPFLESTRNFSSADALFVHLHPWGEGHEPPTPDFLRLVLRTLARPTWAQALREGKYLSLPDPGLVRDAGLRAAGPQRTSGSRPHDDAGSDEPGVSPYGLSDFVQDLRYGRRTSNEASHGFSRMAGELEAQFSPLVLPLGPEARSRYAEYIDLLRYRHGADEAVRVARGHLEQGLDAPLVAVSIQQACKRSGDFDRAAAELAPLSRANPDSPYICLLRGRSLQAIASWEELLDVASSVFAMPSLPSQPTMSARWAELLLESGYPERARAFIEMLPGSSNERTALRYRASLFTESHTRTPQIPTLVINLDQDRRKRAVATGALERAGHTCQVLRAVDARDLPDFALQRVCGAPEVAQEIGAGAVGCALSHIKAWEHIAAHLPGGAFVVEDDAAPYTGIARAADVLSSTGDLDMLFVNERLSSVQGIAPSPVPATSTLEPWEQVATWRPGRTGWGFDGYFISARGAAKLLDILNREGIQEHIDGQAGAYGLPRDRPPSNLPQQTLLDLRRRIDDAQQLRTLTLAYPATTQNNFGYSTIGTITRDRDGRR